MTKGNLVDITDFAAERGYGTFLLHTGILKLVC